MFQICPGIDTWISMLLHLPACCLAVAPVILKRHQNDRSRSWKQDALYDCAKHIVGAVAGNGFLLAMAPVLSTTTKWGTSCSWYLSVSCVDATFGLGLQVWAILGPLCKLSRRYPALRTGQYWDPVVRLRSPKRFAQQVIVWMVLSLGTRACSTALTLILAAPVAFGVWLWNWIFSLAFPTKVAMVAVIIPALSRSVQFLAIDPYMRASQVSSRSHYEDEDAGVLWVPLNGNTA